MDITNNSLFLTLGYLKGQSHFTAEKEAISYNKFEEVLNNEEVINPKFAREIPKSIDEALKFGLERDPTPKRIEKYNIIKKAYNLGLVDNEGNLVSNNLKKVETDYSVLDPLDQSALDAGHEVYDRGNAEYKATIEAYKEEIGFVSYKKTEENKDLIDKAMKSYGETAFKIIMEMDSQELALDNFQDRNTEKDNKNEKNFYQPTNFIA